LSVAEQSYQAVLAVISDGLSISQVASKVGVSRQTLHAWLARYEAEGLEGLTDRSHRPVRCPHQMAAEVEARVGQAWHRGAAFGIRCVSGVAAGRND
jgi:transposase